MYKNIILKKGINLTLLIILFTLYSGIRLKAEDSRITIGERVSFTSEILQEDRSILVYLPQSYGFTDQSYPVLYLLDGDYHFHHASGIVQYLSALGLIPEIIVIGVVNVNRTRDFSPTQVSGLAETGGAPKFLKFMEKELIPFVDRNYRTLPYKILVGHSFGGTFATYSLLTSPDLFNAYISISPFIMYDDNDMVKKAKKMLKSKYNNLKYYMTVGNEPTYFDALEEFSNTIQEKSPKGFEFNYEVYKNDNHGSVPHMSIYNGLGYIFSDWKLTDEIISKGVEAIDQHYASIAKKYGIEVLPPENTLNQLGYQHINNKDYVKAIRVFEENVKRFPKSANVYDSLGEAYELKGDKGKAIENYSKAVEIANKVKHANTGVYESNLKRLKGEK
ncbi:MAG: hypothetical protein K9G76_07510 [Bacteroidales bacterium]|nr:hypothetical protein [Bacteroidales bacterium]MCF8406218.1 hypothetical protein [Bacteroidales bacterium]